MPQRIIIRHRGREKNYVALRLSYYISRWADAYEMWLLVPGMLTSISARHHGWSSKLGNIARLDFTVHAASAPIRCTNKTFSFRSFNFRRRQQTKKERVREGEERCQCNKCALLSSLTLHVCVRLRRYSGLSLAIYTNSFCTLLPSPSASIFTHRVNEWENKKSFASAFQNKRDIDFVCIKFLVRLVKWNDFCVYVWVCVCAVRKKADDVVA